MDEIEPTRQSNRTALIAVVLAAVFAVLLVLQLGSDSEADRVRDQSECRWSAAVGSGSGDCD